MGIELGRHGSRRFVRRLLGASVSVAVAGSLALVAAAPAQAVACGGAAQNGLAIEPTHDPILYTDLGDGLDAAYLGYQVTNSGSARTNLWVRVGDFTGGSVTLAHATDDRQQVPSLGSAATATSFFLVKASTVTTVAQQHTVRVYDRRPDLTGANVLATCDFSFSQVKHTIGANANKVTTISSAPASPVVGETVTVTVTGETGQADGAIWVSPAAASSWPSKALRLESTTIDVNADGNTNTGAGGYEQSYGDTLYIPGSIAALYTAQTTYRATYVFRVTAATSGNPTILPVAQISSGGNFKHTGSYPTLPAIASGSATASTTVAKTITALDVTSLPTTSSPNGVPDAVTYAEVPYRITAASSGGTAVVDEFVDVPDAGVLFKSGSATLTDGAGNVATPVGDPVTSSSDTGATAGALHFTGPFVATATTAATIDYTMYVPLTQGSYVNEAFATINGTTLGASPTAVPNVSVAADGHALTGWTPGTSAGSLTPQTISFTQPADLLMTSTGQSLTATATSGLTPALASDTPSVCSVSAGTVTPVAAGTCTITATQAGDSSYAAATPVSRTLTVSKAPQTITFTQPAAMLTTSTGQALTASSSSGATPTLASGTPAVCSVTATTVTPVAAGDCTVTATQAGSATYATATPVSRTFATSKAPQTITFPQPDGIVLTTPERTVTATSSSGLTPVLTSDTPAVCSVTAGLITGLLAGTCSVTASESGDGTYLAATGVTRTLNVVRATQGVSFAPLADLSLSAVTRTVTASSSTGFAVVFTSDTPATCTVAGGTVTLVATGTCTISATQSGTATYAPVTVTRSFTVTAAVEPPQAAALTSTGAGVAVQSVPVTVPSGGTLTLLGAAGQPADEVTVPGEGRYGVTSGAVTFTPAAGFTGTARPVTYRVTDTFQRTATATYTATVTPLAAAPLTRAGVQGSTLTAQPRSATDLALDAGSVRLAGPAGAQVRSLLVDGVGRFHADADTGLLTFTPAAGFAGTHKATYRLQDTAGSVAQSTLTVTLTALRVEAGTDTVDAGETARVPLTGVPASASVTFPASVEGAGSVTFGRGAVHVATKRSFTGRLQFAVTVRNGTAAVKVTAVVVVRPGAPSGVQYQAQDGGETLVRWQRRPGSPATVRVAVDGRAACTTTKASCLIERVLGPASVITVAVIGADGVASEPVRATRAARGGCGHFGAVYFDSGSAVLDPASRRELDRVAGILSRQGFAQACLVGHTDSDAGNDYNLTLSKRRAEAVAGYLKARVNGIKFTTSHVGESKPSERNDTPAGKRANRRVEIGVG